MPRGPERLHEHLHERLDEFLQYLAGHLEIAQTSGAPTASRKGTVASSVRSRNSRAICGCASAAESPGTSRASARIRRPRSTSPRAPRSRPTSPWRLMTGSFPSRGAMQPRVGRRGAPHWRTSCSPSGPLSRWRRSRPSSRRVPWRPTTRRARLRHLPGRFHRRAQPARGQCPLATWETLRGEPTAACGPAPRRARPWPGPRGHRVRRLRLQRRPP